MTTDHLTTWLHSMTDRLASTGMVVIDRLPTGVDLPTVDFIGGDPDDEREFFRTVEALGAKVAYADVEAWGNDDVEQLHERLRTARRDQGLAPLDQDIRLLDDARARIDDVARASVYVIAGGVAHRLRDESEWAGLLHVAGSRVVLDAAEAANEGAEQQARQDAVDEAAWEAEQALLAADRRRIEHVLAGLQDRLRADETFLATCTGDTARRRYAHEIVRTDAQVAGSLESDVRGSATAAAEAAWSWWKSTGKPAREEELAMKIPALVTDPSLAGTLDQRRHAARAILQREDALAVTRQLVDLLARAAAG
jgi:hypothetical protein